MRPTDDDDDDVAGPISLELGSGSPIAGGAGAELEWVGRAGVRGRRWMRMPLLTVGMLGLQCVWSIEMGYASPYLLSLGLSKSSMSIVFVAGPLSGLIMQPIIGILADRSRSKYGRRRPFMIAGCAVCATGILLLGFTREVAGWVLERGTEPHDRLTIALAVFAIYLIDFSINAVQAVDRALVVDTLRPSQQESGNAWAGRMFGLGSVAGFFVGNIDLPRHMPWLGSTQLQILSILTASFLLLTHGITAFAVQERVLLRDHSAKGSVIFGTVRALWEAARTLPRPIRQICAAQFFAWIGWFPVLFYTSTYIGELYLGSTPLSESDPSSADAATRKGSRALFFHALVSLSSAILLPFLVSSSSSSSSSSGSFTEHGFVPASHSRSHSAFSENNFLYSGWREWVLPTLERFMPTLPLPYLDLSLLWTISHGLFGVCLVSTIFTSSVTTTSVLIAFIGFSWAVAQWAPFSLLGEAILHESLTLRTSLQDGIALSPWHSTAIGGSEEDEERAALMFDADADADGADSPRRDLNHDDFVGGLPMVTYAHVVGTANAEVDERKPRRVRARSDSVASTTADKAGVYLGIMNVAIVVPQFLVTGLAALIFAWVEPPSALPSAPPAGDGDGPAMLLRRSPAGAPTGSVNGIGLVMRLGGLSAFIACWLSWRMTKERRRRRSAAGT